MRNHFVSSGRSVSDLKAHLVLTTKYRRKLLTEEMLSRLCQLLDGLLQQWDCILVECNGESDHVHILFQYTPDIQLSKLVGNIKSVTSRKIRSEFTENLAPVYMKDALWNGSYFLASCGGVSISTLRQYIENQGVR